MLPNLIDSGLPVGTVIHNWDGLKAAFLDSSWGKAVMGWIGNIKDCFLGFGNWVSGVVTSWADLFTGWGRAVGSAFLGLGQGLWDIGAQLMGMGTKFLLFINPVDMAVRVLTSLWDGLKASLMDTAWGQAIMGWIDKITGAFQAIPGAMNWIQDKLSWIPGIEADPAKDIPKTSPSLEAPKRSMVVPGGASRSIANAVTNNNQSSSTMINVGKIVTNRPGQEFGHQLAMGV